MLQSRPIFADITAFLWPKNCTRTLQTSMSWEIFQGIRGIDFELTVITTWERGTESMHRAQEY